MASQSVRSLSVLVRVSCLAGTPGALLPALPVPHPVLRQRFPAPPLPDVVKGEWQSERFRVSWVTSETSIQEVWLSHLTVSVQVINISKRLLFFCLVA